MRALAGALLHRRTRGELAAAGVGVLAVASVAVLLGVVGAGWWRGAGGTYAPHALLAEGHVTPLSALFGDVLTMQADVLVDARRIDPGSVQLDAHFRPFRIRSQSLHVEPRIGRAALVEARYLIQCVTSACLALTGPQRGGTRAVELPAARVTARRHKGGTVSARVVWPPFVVHSRLSSEQAAMSTPELEPDFVPPAISWAITPDLLGALALAGASLLVLGAAWLVGSTLLANSGRLRRLPLPPSLSRVELALVLAEYAAANGEVEEGRKALHRLSIELFRAGERELAEDARALAWSTSTPSAARVGELARMVRSNGAG